MINHTGVCTSVNKPNNRNKFMEFRRKDGHLKKRREKILTNRTISNQKKEIE